MPDVTRRRTGELLRVLFGILMDKPEGLPARDALVGLEGAVKLTPYEAGTYESGRRFEKIVRFATVDCVKAGWLLKQKGRWSVTEEGRQAYQRFTDPEAFYKEAIRLYRKWKKSQPATEDAEEPEDGSSAKTATITFEEATESAWNEIEQFLTGMTPYDFQDLVGALFRGLGYHIAWTAPPGKDGGIDILAWPDALGARTPRIKVQVKRQAQAVNVEGLRAFMALLGDDDLGIFVSTGGFTKDAQETARTQEKRKVTLIDLERLFDLWVEQYPKLQDEDRRRLPIQPIYFLAPEG